MTFGSGNVQETYWEIRNDTLYPAYTFEFGGIGQTYCYNLESLKGKSVKSGEIMPRYLNEDIGWEKQSESIELKRSFINVERKRTFN